MDEAHGAHFGFSQGFPQKALAFGADLCIESVHKTLPAYTQSALLHYRKNPWIDLERVKQYLGIYQTSSPSYILMAGIDRCTRILREQGTELFAAYEQRLHDFYEKCRTLQRITVLSPDGKLEKTGKMIRASGRGIRPNPDLCRGRGTARAGTGGTFDGALSSGTGDGLRSLCDGPDNAYGYTGRV